MCDIKGLLTLEESIESSFNIFEQWFYHNNDLDGVIGQCDEHSHHDIYYSAMRTHCHILKAKLTFDQTELDKALKASIQTTRLCDSKRRKGFLNGLIKMILTPDYEKYSEIEMHSQLLYAMCLAYNSMMNLFKSHSFVDVFKAVNGLRVSKNIVKECRIMLRTRSNWLSDTSRRQFEAGVHLERGVRHLLISNFEPKTQRIARVLGYRGCRNVAISELGKCALNSKGIYSSIADVAVLGNSLFVGSVVNCGQKTFNFCEVIINRRLTEYPNSIVYKIFKAKITQMNGSTESAINEFQSILAADKHKFQMIPLWELVYASALMCQWDSCMKYAQELNRLQSSSHPWSILTTYCEAVITYFMASNTEDKALKGQATELMKSLVTLRSKLTRKTTSPLEMACIESAKMYLKNNEFLFLPVLNMLYNANQLYLIEENTTFLEKHLAILEEEMKVYLKEFDNVDYIDDNYYEGLFYKGVILKHMLRLIEAQHCFNTVLEVMHRRPTKRLLKGKTLMELAFIQMMLDKRSEAKDYLKKSLKQFNCTSIENIFVVRIMAAITHLDVIGGDDHHIDEKPHSSHLDMSEEYVQRLSELTKLKKMKKSNVFHFGLHVKHPFILFQDKNN